MKRIQKKSLTIKIFDYFTDVFKGLFELGTNLILHPRKAMREVPGYRSPFLPHSVVKREIQRRINKLKNQGYLRETEKGLEITPKGRIEMIKVILWKKLKAKKWDGKWRLIIFDIPEMSRRDRDFLRRELKWIGFWELQKSVWIFPYDMEREMMTLLRLWKLEFKGDIRFAVVEKISSDEELKKYFNLEPSPNPYDRTL